MTNLTENLKEQMGSMMQQSKGERMVSNKISDQVLAAAVQRQARNYEMPKKVPLPSESTRTLQPEDKRISNLYKRDRSSSNTAKRPPIPFPERELNNMQRLSAVTLDQSTHDVPSSSSIIAEMHY